MKVLMLAIVVHLLAGCVATGSTPTVSERPISQQTSKDESRERARIHTELGALYLQDGRIGVAMEEAAIAVASDSSYAGAYNLLGLGHMYLQEFSVAEENFKKALNLAPNDPEISHNYGWFLCQTERSADSIPYFMTAVKNPHYATPSRAFKNAGICSLKSKKLKESEEFFMRALQGDPRNIEAIFWLADVYYLTERFVEARVKIADLHRLTEPNSESLWLGLLIERRLGDREGENRLAVQLRKKFPNTPEYQRLLQGKYE